MSLYAPMHQTNVPNGYMKCGVRPLFAMSMGDCPPPARKADPLQTVLGGSIFNSSDTLNETHTRSDNTIEFRVNFTHGQKCINNHLKNFMKPDSRAGGWVTACIDEPGSSIHE